MRKSKIPLYLVAFCILFAMAGCNFRFNSMKNEQFDILKQSVAQLLGNGYEVKTIDVTSEGYTNDDESEYVVDFVFSLNKPMLLLPSTNLPGKLIFSKDTQGEWKCTFNSGNPGELFNILQ